MYVDVDISVTPASVALRNQDDFGEFKVVISGSSGDLAAVEAALKPYARVTPEGYAFFDFETLDQLSAGRGADPTWLESLAGMVRYAESKGWVDEHGAIRAHCEPA